MTSLPLVHTSIVVKSTEARTSQWARMKLFYVDWRFRSGAGSTPCAFRTLPKCAAAHFGNCAQTVDMCSEVANLVIARPWALLGST